MTTIRYLLDENISTTVRRQLLFHEPTMELICVGDDNAPPHGTPDPDILIWIEQHNYILVSRNRRTMPQHLSDHLTNGRQLPGILLLKRQISRGTLIKELLLIWQVSSMEEYFNRIRYIPL